MLTGQVLWTWRGFSWGTLPLLEVKLANFFSMVNYYPRNLKLKNSSSLLTSSNNRCQFLPGGSKRLTSTSRAAAIYWHIDISRYNKTRYNTIYVLRISIALLINRVIPLSTWQLSEVCRLARAPRCRSNEQRISKPKAKSKVWFSSCR